EGAAREVRREDFEDFDLLIAMDSSNLRALRQLAPSEQARSKLRLLREFDPADPRPADVPDPYYGASGGFEEGLRLVQASCEGLLAQIRRGEASWAYRRVGAGLITEAFHMILSDGREAFVKTRADAQPG